MSIKEEKDSLLKVLQKDIKLLTADVLSKRIRMPPVTIYRIATGRSSGTMKTWIKIEKYYQRRKDAGR